VSNAVTSKLTSTLLGVAFPCMVDDQTTTSRGLRIP
jgi:hypothetical protein